MRWLASQKAIRFRRTLVIAMFDAVSHCLTPGWLLFASVVFSMYFVVSFHDDYSHRTDIVAQIREKNLEISFSVMLLRVFHVTS